MPLLTRATSRTALCLLLIGCAPAVSTVTSASAAPRASGATGASLAVADTSWPTLRPGSSGVDVVTAQHLLRAMSTLASPAGDSGVLVVDGRYGRDTTRAVREFQRRYGLAADGVIGARTWEALVVTVGRSSRSEAVMGLQVQLRALGHDVALDGRYGRQTAVSVARFQESAGLRVDGVTGRATWRALLVCTDGPSRRSAGAATG